MLDTEDLVPLQYWDGPFGYLVQQVVDDALFWLTKSFTFT